MCRLTLLLALLISALPIGAWATRVVRGFDGQPALVLDHGRSLRRYSVLHAGVSPPGGLASLGPLEKARLDGKRLLLGSTLSTRHALQRIVRIVQLRIPYSPQALYDSFTARALRQSEAIPLSFYVRSRVGICRERAFLLAAMVREGGLPAKVKYGVVYDLRGRQLGGHAWVEVRVGSQQVRLDPNMPESVVFSPARHQMIETLEDGAVRRVVGMRSRRLIYIPTPDLAIEPGR